MSLALIFSLIANVILTVALGVTLVILFTRRSLEGRAVKKLRRVRELLSALGDIRWVGEKEVIDALIKLTENDEHW